MTAYPVGRSGVPLAGPLTPATVIVNNGPGTLYLYRNAAVSMAAYDTIVGPSGSFQWGGGELWGASDTNTVVNLLPGLSSYDSGTTNVTGTVSVGGGSSSSSVKSRGTAIGDYGGTGVTRITVPSAVQAGDLLVAFLATNTSVSIGTSWVGGLAQSGAFSVYRYTRIATAGDANTPYTWNVSSSSYAAGIMLALTGTASVSTVGGGTSDGAGDVLISTGTVPGGTYLIGASTMSTTPPTWKWGTAIEGGPSGPSDWSGLITNASDIALSVAVTVTNWSTPSAFNAKSDGVSNNGYAAVLSKAA